MIPPPPPSDSLAPFGRRRCGLVVLSLAVAVAVLVSVAWAASCFVLSEWHWRRAGGHYSAYSWNGELVLVSVTPPPSPMALSRRGKIIHPVRWDHLPLSRLKTAPLCDHHFAGFGYNRQRGTTAAVGGDLSDETLIVVPYAGLMAGACAVVLPLFLRVRGGRRRRRGFSVLQP